MCPDEGARGSEELGRSRVDMLDRALDKLEGVDVKSMVEPRLRQSWGFEGEEEGD